MGRDTGAKQPSALSTSAPTRTHFRGTGVLPVRFLPLSHSTWLFKAWQSYLSVYHFCIISLTYTTYASLYHEHTNEQGLEGGKQRHQMCYTDRSTMREEGTHNVSLQYSGSSSYWLPLQWVQREELPEGRVRESNLAIGLRPCLGRIFLLADHGESLYWVDIHNEHPLISLHTHTRLPKPDTRVEDYRLARKKCQWNSAVQRQKSETNGVVRVITDIHYGTISITFRLLRAVISGN